MTDRTGAVGSADQLAVVLPVAVRTWPADGVPEMLTPLRRTTLGLMAVPPRSPVSLILPLVVASASGVPLAAALST